MTRFNVPLNMAVVSSSYVTDDGMAILEVTHEQDEEGASLWQFHCGNGDYSMSKMRLVGLGTILNIDNSIEEVADLEMGWRATRETRSGDWTRVRC